LFVPPLALPDVVLKLPPKPAFNGPTRIVIKNKKGTSFFFKLFIRQSLFDFKYYVFYGAGLVE